ncbi:Uncharacterised protein [Vibrio cholerae]|nr:Uncharacterised protein [Vibrio cholerae]CSB67409.1 Uncharacterised protein [Vibrio cholerae]CSC45933.1 Uncharacterised protein [Vibrio cholerae]CSI96081.1 Uncharacterised protein [Vibrio cholerae]
MEKPSKNFKNSSARTALEGSSHIMITFKPCSPRRKPNFASRSITASASPVVRTNGIITSTFFNPISWRTRLMACVSSSKQSSNTGEM